LLSLAFLGYSRLLFCEYWQVRGVRLRNSEIALRDPFVFVDREKGRYLLYGSIDSDCWRGKGIGFNAYAGNDLEL
jgi:hypothetical protein